MRFKFSGLSVIVHVDKTMLNHSVKAHRGRTPHNRTDTLCIVEYCSLHRCFAQIIISNKQASTAVPALRVKYLLIVYLDG